MSFRGGHCPIQYREEASIFNKFPGDPNACGQLTPVAETPDCGSVGVTRVVDGGSGYFTDWFRAAC